MAALLKPGGTFYLSTPIGRERVEFNANWVFDPRTLIQYAKTNGLRLQRSTVIGVGATINSSVLTDEILQQLALTRYSLGIFVFIKTSQ